MNNYFFEDQKESNNHSFDTAIAKYYSIEKAILLKDLKYFCAYKLRNSQLKKGLPLVYYSSTALEGQYNYMSAKSIGRWLNDLIKDGILFSCVANKIKYDRTKSYLVNFKKYNDIKNQLEFDEKLDENFLKYCNNTIAQNEQRKTQDGQLITQNGETIPTHTSTQTPIFLQTEKIETPQTEKHESDYVDFNNLNGTQKPKLLGQIKGLLQKEFNMFTFDKNDTFKINQAIYKVKDNLTAYNKSNGIFISVLDENVLEAFKTSMVIFKGKFKDSTNWSIPLFASCLNVNDYIKIDDTAKLLSLASDEIKEKYYKIAARDGKEIANEILRKVLKHKI
jgi:hypothetical protein